MTQREQIQYHPGWSYKPVLPDPDFETHTRLALKAIELAVEHGEVMTMQEGYERSAENWYDVTQMAEARTDLP